MQSFHSSSGLDELGVVLADRGAEHHDVGRADVLAAVADEDLRAQPLEPRAHNE